MEQNYNYKRDKLHLPEYGRHIQKMVDSLKSIEDRAERNKQAHAVIAVMGNLNPLLRDTADFTHKLWDHLYIISGFELDVDSPYPLPTRETVEARPAKMECRRNHIQFKHYGKYISEMISTIASGKEMKETKDQAMGNVARYMRTKSFEYNQEHPNNEMIIKDIRRMAKSDIDIDEELINNIRSNYKNTQTPHPQKGQKGHKNYKGQKNQKGQNNQKMNGGGATQHNNHQNRNNHHPKSGQQRYNNNNNR